MLLGQVIDVVYRCDSQAVVSCGQDTDTYVSTAGKTSMGGCVDTAYKCKICRCGYDGAGVSIDVRDDALLTSRGGNGNNSNSNTRDSDSRRSGIPKLVSVRKLDVDDEDNVSVDITCDGYAKGMEAAKRFAAANRAKSLSRSAKEHPLPEKSPQSPPSSSEQRQVVHRHLKALNHRRLCASTNNESKDRSTATKEESPKFDAAEHYQRFLSKRPRKPNTKQ
jgi:hypothetical protein